MPVVNRSPAQHDTMMPDNIRVRDPKRLQVSTILTDSTSHLVVRRRKECIAFSERDIVVVTLRLIRAGLAGMSVEAGSWERGQGCLMRVQGTLQVFTFDIIRYQDYGRAEMPIASECMA